MDKKAPLPQTLLGAHRLLKRDKRLLVFGFFLLISTALWTLNKLSHTYTTEISAKILLVEGRHVGVMLTGGKVNATRLRVRATGYDLMRYLLFSSKTFRVDLGLLRYFEGAAGESVLPVGQIRNMVAQQLSPDFDLQAIIPDSIYFQLSPVASKKVPIRSSCRIDYLPQYMQQGEPVLEPDSVIVSGPQKVVDAITEIGTEEVKKEKVINNFSGKASLITPPQTFLSHENVSYKINVQRVTQITRELPIRLVGAPDSLYVELLPASAVVSISVATEEYHRLKQDEQYLTAYYPELHQSLSGQVRVNLSQLPTYVLSTSIKPAFVTIIVKQKP
ncbi:MAG: hypothetical protein LBO71_10270 [Prevotellaceae bacterium]|jgi:hypothetical protein|nr:hypothetical protein [Prevotellaceae bacterium]